MSLNAAARRRLPSSDFALPGQGKGPQGKGSGSYPIDTIGRARDALSRGSANASPEQLAAIKRKVHDKYPSIKIGAGGYVPNPAQNRAIHAGDAKPRDHALALASATHLLRMGHITPAHHAQISNHVHNVLAQMKQQQPPQMQSLGQSAMGAPPQGMPPQMGGSGSPFGFGS